MSAQGGFKLRSSAIAGALAGMALLFGTEPASAQTAYEKLVAMAKAEAEKVGGQIKMALDWPDEDAKPVLAEFMKVYPFVKKIDYERETGIDPFGRYLISFKQGEPAPYDIMHVASEYEQQYVEAGIFVKPPFEYKELDKSLPAGWPKLGESAIDPNGFFMSTTGNVRGIIYNPTIVKGNDIPTKWEDCIDPKWKKKVLLDARNKLQAFQHDPKSRDWIIKLLKDMQANEAVLERGQAGVVQKVGSGEYPIGCGVNYHTAFRAIEVQGVKTIKYVQPDPIPLEFATRLFVFKSSRTPALTQLFTLWIASDGQEALGKYAWRGMPWNPKAHKYEISKGKKIVLCDADCALRFEDFEKEYQEALKIPVAKK